MKQRKKKEKMTVPGCFEDKMKITKECCKGAKGRPIQMIRILIKIKVKQRKKKKREDDSRRWRCQVASETK